MTFAEALMLGLIQGLAEWLPVSSEGVVTAVHSLAFDSTLTEAVAFSLWLHLGTVISVLVAFRTEVIGVIKDTLTRPTNPTPMLAFLFIATAASAPLGFVLLVGLEEFSERIGAAAMAIVGVLMLITGTLLLRSRAEGTRTREDVSWVDAVLTGVAQGFAALPGLSRSGLTVSALLSRRVDRREALILSFLLSIPASLGAGLYAAIDTGSFASSEALIALAAAAVSGFVTIKVLMNVAQRVNFGWFVVIVGLSVIAGALWQALS